MSPDTWSPRPIIITRGELELFHSWLPFGARWWVSVALAACAGSVLTVFAIAAAGRFVT